MHVLPRYFTAPISFALANPWSNVIAFGLSFNSSSFLKSHLSAVRTILTPGQLSEISSTHLLATFSNESGLSTCIQNSSTSATKSKSAKICLHWNKAWSHGCLRMRVRAIDRIPPDQRYPRATVPCVHCRRRGLEQNTISMWNGRKRDAGIIYRGHNFLVSRSC